MRSFSLYPFQGELQTDEPMESLQDMWNIPVRTSAGQDASRRPGMGFAPVQNGGGGTGFAFVAPLVSSIPSIFGGLTKLFGGGTDKYSAKVLPLLSKIVQASGRPALSVWFGDVKGLNGNMQPLMIGNDGDNNSVAEQMLKDYARQNGIIYSLWMETVRAFHQDGTTSTVGSYNLDTGQLSFTPVGAGQSTLVPGGGVVPTGTIGGISTTTLLMLGAGALGIYLIARR